MIRAALALAISLAAVSAVAQTDPRGCAIQGGIVTEAKAARLDGMPAGEATETIKAGLSGEESRFRPAVQLLVDWVYTISDDMIGEDVGAAYEQTCRDQ